jgi:hypothetical protein
MNKLLLLLFPILFFSCENKDKSKNIISEDQLPDKPKSLSAYAKRHVESTLKIGPSEKYELKIYKANLDGDDKEDAIIAVNRLQFAINEAAQSENPAKRAEVAYMGNFNYIFYFDGGLDLISPPIAIPSSPLLPLKISFENVSSSDFKDIIIDFRIRNASYRDYYFIKNHTPARVFQWKNFDGLGTFDAIAFSFSYEPGKVNAAKNIVIHKAKIGLIPIDADLNTYIPELTKTNHLERMFFYLPSQGKYVTESN